MGAKKAARQAARTASLRNRAATDLKNRAPIAYDESYFDVSGLGQ
jgi:hypothetical protein